MPKRKETPDVLAEVLGGELVSTPAETSNKSSRQATRRTQPEQVKWEYTIVTFQDYRGWRPRFINGYELKDWTSGPLIHEYLEAMSEDGWDLVAASAGEHLYGSTDNHQLFFKRPKYSG